MSNETHKYLCWLDQIHGLGRKRIFALLRAAGEASLFNQAGPGGDSLSFPATMEKTGKINRENQGEIQLFSPADTGETARLLYTAPETQLAFVCSEAIPSKKHAAQAAQLILCARKQDPARIEEKLARTGICFSCIIEESFPSRLRMIPDPPFGIYCRGPLLPSAFSGSVPGGSVPSGSVPDGSVPDRFVPGGSLPGGSLPGGSVPDRSVPGGSLPDGSVPGGSITQKAALPGIDSPAAAVIGARFASGYGREQARRFSYRMASRGITIISGMARGIDGIAQTAALDAGGRSCAVLGCGVDICYPEENRPLYDRLLQQGGILSEYPPGTPPEARLFPLRNRIISGLSDAVLVIEARRKSGTLITVDMALEQGRDVFALPGRVSDSLSDGCNRLIRQGAAPATCPEDLLEYFFGTNDPVPGAGKSLIVTGGPAPVENDKRLTTAAINKMSGGIHESEIEEEKGKSTEQGCKDGRTPCFEKGDLTGRKKEGGSGCGKEDSRESVLDGSESHAYHVLCAGRESSGPEFEEGGKNICGRISPLHGECSRKIRHLTAGSGLCVPETDGEEESEKKPASLEEMILGILSSEDGMHLERILEQTGSVPAEGRAFDGPAGLSRVIPCLLRLKTDGRVEETSPGYFRKI